MPSGELPYPASYVVTQTVPDTTSAVQHAHACCCTTTAPSLRTLPMGCGSVVLVGKCPSRSRRPYRPRQPLWRAAVLGRQGGTRGTPWQQQTKVWWHLALRFTTQPSSSTVAAPGQPASRWPKLDSVTLNLPMQTLRLPTPHTSRPLGRAGPAHLVHLLAGVLPHNVQQHTPVSTRCLLGDAPARATCTGAQCSATADRAYSTIEHSKNQLGVVQQRIVRFKQGPSAQHRALLVVNLLHGPGQLNVHKVGGRMVVR
jgi:hypothetical protein